MKRLFASFLSLSLLLTSCRSTNPIPPSPTTPSPMDTPWDDRSLFKSGLVESEQSVLDELQGASVYHIDLTIPDNFYQIRGTEEVRYTNTEDTTLYDVWFRLFPNILGGEMKISNLTVDGSTVVPAYKLENSLMIVPLPRPLEAGQSIVIKMGYAVTVPQSVELDYGVLAYYEDVLALAHAYPMICVHDNEGWNAEIPRHYGDITYVDAAFYLVRIHAPKGLTLVTSGSEISHEEDGQVQTLTVANGPARDFYLAASWKYEKVSKKFGDVTINSYADKRMTDGAQLALETAGRAIDDFSKRYAPYPYTELDIVATPNTALGIEYPGITAITTRIYDLEQETSGLPTRILMESVVAHEVGHQWFYNLVGDDQLDDPWLDESLTQFATLQYYSDRYGEGGYRGYEASLYERWDRVSRARIPIGLPVAGYSNTEYGAIVYGRGPLFFVALKEEMGAAAFDSFLKDYVERLSWGISTPEYLKSLAEKHCSCNLDILFDEWVVP